MKMGIFDKPKNYRISKPSSIIRYEERYQRLVEIINIVIDDIHNPLLAEVTPKLKQKINSELINLKVNVDHCRESFDANHADLDGLAKQMRAYIFYILRIYQNKHLDVIKKSNSKLCIELDIYRTSSFSYDAKKWMIKINDEDLWYLGR